MPPLLPRAPLRCGFVCANTVARLGRWIDTRAIGGDVVRPPALSHQGEGALESVDPGRATGTSPTMDSFTGGAEPDQGTPRARGCRPHHRSAAPVWPVRGLPALSTARPAYPGEAAAAQNVITEPRPWTGGAFCTRKRHVKTATPTPPRAPLGRWRDKSFEPQIGRLPEGSSTPRAARGLPPRKMRIDPRLQASAPASARHTLPTDRRRNYAELGACPAVNVSGAAATARPSVPTPGRNRTGPTAGPLPQPGPPDRSCMRHAHTGSASMFPAQGSDPEGWS